MRRTSLFFETRTDTILLPQRKVLSFSIVPEFEEIFIGKPESFVRERLGEPAKWDLNGPFYKDGEQVFRKVVRYDCLVHNESPDQATPPVILKYDKSNVGNVTLVE